MAHAPTLIAATLAAAAAVVGPLGPTAAHASPAADLAMAVGDANHDRHSAWVIERLVTLELGDACWPKVLAKGATARNLLASMSRQVQRYAKVVTGDDWYAIEGQPGGRGVPVVDPLVAAFGKRFHLTVVVEGADCDASGNAMWLKYTGETLRALTAHPPASGTARVTVRAAARARGVTVDVDRKGTTFVVTGPRDLEVSGWPDAITNAVRKVAAKP